MITYEAIPWQLTAKSHAKDSDGICWTTHYVIGETARILRGVEYFPVTMRCEEHNNNKESEAMTVEERTKDTVTKLWESMNGGLISHDVFCALIAQALRDQIEDCAKIA